MAWLVLKALQKDFGANDADDAWRGSLWTAFQKDLGSSDADDSWLGSFFEGFPERPWDKLCC